MPNMVRTAKYEYYNFLPKFLWEEFNPATKIANVYFLFIAALQASVVGIHCIQHPPTLRVIFVCVPLFIPERCYSSCMLAAVNPRW